MLKNKILSFLVVSILACSGILAVCAAYGADRETTETTNPMYKKTLTKYDSTTLINNAAGVPSADTKKLNTRFETKIMECVPLAQERCERISRGICTATHLYKAYGTYYGRSVCACPSPSKASFKDTYYDPQDNCKFSHSAPEAPCGTYYNPNFRQPTQKPSKSNCSLS